MSRYDGDIVITGISGRLPESSNIEEFKENLMKGMDMVTDDERRWIASDYGIPGRCGQIKNLSSFDASFFKINPKQARVMDPQLRIMLEVTYETLVDAGVNPFTLRGSRTGVFISATTSDANDFWKKDPNGYALLGCARSMFANRISFAFHLIGPSYMIDTACSSTLTALHEAVTAIRTGDCDSAIVGGLHLLLNPAYTVHFQKLQMLSQDGKCKSFDATANGFVRSEAIVAIYVQKAPEARRLYATVIGTKVNTDGYKSEGITHPNGEIQYQMMRELYSETGINPADVVYVEAHGTGTSLGDPIEVNSIDKHFCKDRKTPLLIGSVKTNMGHAEPVSGLCSLAKVLIAMETGVIPANLHFLTPNSKIPALNEGRIQVVNKATPWNGGLVGINAFGFGGTNAHVILRNNPKPKLPSPMLCGIESLPKLVIVSGRTEEAVDVLLNKAREHRKDNEFLSLLHAVHKINISGHDIRGYEILDIDDTREVIKMADDIRRPICYVFSGMATQWPGMGRELLSIKEYQRSLRKCADVLEPHGIDLMNIINNGTYETYENNINTMVAIVAIQIALVDLLASIDIFPDNIIGHSVGELSCAYADDTLTLEQTILVAYYRGKAIADSKIEPGAMAVIGLSWQEAKKMCSFDIDPACHNSAKLVTVSGPIESVRKFVELLKSKNIFAKMIDTSGIAFHSRYIASAGLKLRASLDRIIPSPKRRSTRWISTSISEDAWTSSLAQFSSSEYYENNLVSPVLFQEAMAQISKDAITIEIAPHCLLQTILQRSLPPSVTNISLQKREHPNNLAFLLSNLGKLYVAGGQPNISKLYPPVSFPVSRGTPMIGPLIKWDHSTTWEVPSFKSTLKSSKECVIEVDLSKETDAFIAEHKINGQIIFPATGCIVIVWKTFAKLKDIDFQRLPVIFENLWFQRAIIIPEKGAIKFSIDIQERTGYFEILESRTVVASGNIRAYESIENDQLKLPSLPIDKKTLLLKTEDIYKELRLRGYEYYGIFKGIKSCDQSITNGELRWSNEWISYLDTMLHFLILTKNRRLMFVSRIQYVMIDPVLHKQLAAKLSEGAGLPVYNHKNIVKSGGIEIREVQPIAIFRQQTQVNPKYERYVFVSYENPHGLVDNSTTSEKMQALITLLQIVCENVTAFKIKVVEIAGERAVDALLTPLVIDILNGELFTVDLQVAVTTSPDNYIASFNRMNVNVDVIKWDAINAPPVQNVHLAIATDVLSNRSYMKNMTTTLKPGCFILLEESIAQVDLETALKKMNLILIARQIDLTGKTYLLLKKQEDKVKSIVIRITGKNLSWLESLKAALKKSHQEVLLVSEGEELLGLVGFMTCIRQETANARYVFIQDKNAPKFDLSKQFYKEQLDKRLMANVLKGGRWGSYRHLPLDKYDTMDEHAYVNILIRGDFSSLRWIQSPLKYYKCDEISNSFCRVYYASLNYRDIMLVSGKLSVDALPGKMVREDCILGVEFSGKDSNDRRVMGIVRAGGLATIVLTDPDFFWEVPDHWTLEQAATVPFAYAISYYALSVRGRLKAGESVLIHSGADDVGQAAIAIALHTSCKIFTTVDTQEEREYLKQIFPLLSYIGNSQDKNFEQLILIKTQGRGVDVVLNSLTEDKLQASIRCLAMNGRFLELGKYDSKGDRVNTNTMFLKNTTFHYILMEMLLENYEEKKEVIMHVSEGIRNGTVRPLISTVFSSQQLEEAFGFMASGKHIGKVLLKMRDEEKLMSSTSKIANVIPRIYMNSNKSYVLIGGLGGCGLELTDWIISRGAKFIVLVSRSGIRTGYQALCVHRWRENGAVVIISTADVTTLPGAERLIEESNQLAPIGGIFNLAAVLRDGLFENLEEIDFKSVILPKVDSTKNLDTISRKSCPLLDYFVVFSSISSGRGNSGQSNYGFANSAMERMMEQRHADGLHGLAIQWGAIRDVGLIAETMKDNNIDLRGTLPQSISSCLAIMDTFLQQPYPVLSSMIVAEKRKSVNNDSKIALVEAVANIFGIKDVNLVNADYSFDRFGMDSLSYTAIKQILEREYDIVLSYQEIHALTINKLRDLSTAKNRFDNRFKQHNGRT